MFNPGLKPMHCTAVPKYMRVYFFGEQLRFIIFSRIDMLVEYISDSGARQFLFKPIAEQRLFGKSYIAFHHTDISAIQMKCLLLRGTVRIFFPFPCKRTSTPFYPNEDLQFIDQQFPIFSPPLHTSSTAWQNLFCHHGSVDLVDSILSLFRQQKDVVLSAYYVFSLEWTRLFDTEEHIPDFHTANI